ncbi:phage tail length tape measure family protein [uncultured Sphingomonas sp.]|uniref:phage tail length tape measure family protein n=1 Tax=uncultured Sphingomonas sp. TaxID=158754 RepID=UPI0025DD27DD|nr:phage tail length tape measure family protein [uncultured Sphingomonas sp.]
MDTGSPDLGVDFVINFGDSFGGLKTLDDLIGTTSANAVREFQRLQKAVDGGLGMSEASAQFRTLDASATRALRSAAKEAANAERAGEALVRQLEKQNATFGKSREEVRAMRVEEAALAAERTKNSDLAGRLRAELQLLVNAEAEAAAMAQTQAQAVREAAFAYNQFEAAARRGMALAREADARDAAVAREAEAQAVRDAAFAYNQFERAAREGMAIAREEDARAAAVAHEAEAQALRDAAFAYNQFQVAARAGMTASREIDANAAAAERLRLSTDPLYAATKRVNDEIAESTRLFKAGAIAEGEYIRQQAVLTERLNAHTVVQDTNTVAAKRGSGALTQLSFQLNDVATMAAAGSPPFQILATQAGQIVQVFQMAEGGAKGLALELGGLLLRFAPLIGFVAAAGAGLALFVRWVNEGVTNNQLTKDLGDITGGADATKQELYKLKDETVTWGDTTKAIFSVVGHDVAEAFVGDMKGMSSSVKSVLDDMTSYGRKALAALYAGVAGTRSYLNEVEKGGLLGLGKMMIGLGDPKLIEKTYGAAYDAADKYLTKLGARIKTAAIGNARERIAKSIGFNNEPKPKTDRHADQLAREAAATEAQIRNLYKLADAYGVSGAAALIAEARVKAESEAIKKRADIEEAVARQVRLSVAQRVADSAKSTAGLRDEALIQEQINAGVADGSIATERANVLLRERLADLPLLAALEAARTVKDLKGTQEATKALEEQRAARDRLTDAQRAAQIATATIDGNDRLAELREELRLVGATEAVRVRALAVLRATQEASRKDWTGPKAEAWIQQQADIAVAQLQVSEATDAWNASLGYTSDLFGEIDHAAQGAARGMSDAFGSVGASIGDALTIMTAFYADQANLQQAHDAAIRKAAGNQAAIAHEQQLYAIRSSSLQIGAYGDMSAAAKRFFKEGSAGYKALGAAEKAFRIAQFAMSVQAMVQNAAETLGFVANSAAKATAAGAEGVATQSKLPFPANIAAMAATAAALVAAGVAIFGGGGGGSSVPKSNTGTGTVLGDADAKSESLKRSIDQLREIDTVTSVFARQMAGSLRSIDDQIGGLAAVLVRSGNVDASSGVIEGFKSDVIGSILGKVPVIGGFLSSLFGSKTTVLASGLYGGAQSVGSILSNGFDASTYSDVQKKKKFFGLTTSTKTSTQFGAADADLERQFTLILGSFASAIAGAAAPLGEATSAVEARLNGFVVNIGKIDLKGLTGTQIQEKLEAVFGAAADGMAEAAFPGIARFQKAGEGAFETLVRVASTLEAVSSSLDLIGGSARAMSIDAKLGLADQFDSVGDLTNAMEAYFGTYFSEAEQAAAKTAQLGRVFESMGLTMPATLHAFRALVEAQDLTTTAGQQTYATLLQLAPAFADLQKSMAGAKSAADVLAERQDLERKLLELNGDTAALRALDLAKLDESNRALQQQIWAIEDAKQAADAAKDLRDAWTSVGDSIMDEVKRIRGLTDNGGGDTFASLMGQFNAATAAARAGDLDAAKSLPGLSQSLLNAAAEMATSRQELARMQAQTAASLEATYGLLNGLPASTPAASPDRAILEAMSTSVTAPVSGAANDDVASVIRDLKEETASMKRDLTSALAVIAGNTAKVAKKLDDVTAESGGNAVTIASVAA